HSSSLIRSGCSLYLFCSMMPSIVLSTLFPYTTLFRSLLHDQYLWLGEQKTRSWAEFEVMRYLYDLEVPVPEPIWASWHRHGFYYRAALATERDRKSTRLNSSHVSISYAVFCLKKKNKYIAL